MISSECPTLLNKIAEDLSLLEYLFSLFSSETLNLTLAGYFLKAFSALMNRCPLKLLEFLFGDTAAVQSLLKHLQAKSIAEALLRVLSVDEDIYVPQRKQLIEILADLLSVDNPLQLGNVSSLLVDFNQRAADVKLWREIMTPLASQFTLGKLLNNLENGSDASAKASLVVLTSLVSNPKFMELLTPDLSQFTDLIRTATPGLEKILESGLASTLSTPFGETIPRVGETKLQCVDFLAALSRCNSQEMYTVLVHSKVLVLATELFFRNQWSSFLHQGYLQLIQAMVGGMDAQMLIVFLSDSDVVRKVAEAGVTDKLSSGKEIRKCALGYISRLAQLLQKAGESSSDVAQFLDTAAGWKEYVNDTLRPILKVESTAIGSDRKPSDEFESAGEAGEIELSRLTTDVDVSGMQKFSSFFHPSSNEEAEPE